MKILDCAAKVCGPLASASLETSCNLKSETPFQECAFPGAMLTGETDLVVTEKSRYKNVHRGLRVLQEQCLSTPQLSGPSKDPKAEDRVVWAPFA